jgi:hypothetical protein
MTQKQKVNFGFRPATDQEIAEAYVRQQRPALMEEVERWSDAGMSWVELPTINLQDWLAALPDYGRFSDFYWEEGDDVVIQFNRTTGQPATEADFKAFNDIVSV